MILFKDKIYTRETRLYFKACNYIPKYTESYKTAKYNKLKNKAESKRTIQREGNISCLSVRVNTLNFILDGKKSVNVKEYDF